MVGGTTAARRGADVHAARSECTIYNNAFVAEIGRFDAGTNTQQLRCLRITWGLI